MLDFRYKILDVWVAGMGCEMSDCFQSGNEGFKDEQDLAFWV